MFPSIDSQLKKLFFCLISTCSVVLTSHHFLARQAFSADSLVTFEQATKNGLQQAWFAQARVDAARNRVSRWTLSKDEIFALTTSSTIHSMNAETGKTLWIAQVGNPDYPSVGPAANSNRVAILNSSNLYMLDRKDGHVLWSRAVGGAAGAAPALSETFAYVALINGRVEGYSLDAPHGDTWQYQSVGRIFHSPTATGQHVAWPTSSGYLYVGNADEARVFFRIETNEEIIAAPAEWGSLFYVASLDGYLYCYDGSTGGQLWRYSTGMPIISKPVVIDNRAYVASEMPALHAVDATTGDRLWTVEGAVQFVAQAAQHIYAADRHGNLLVIEKETGGIAGQINTGDGVYPLLNDQSDRIFLVRDTGLVQCLHEIGADQPTFYRKTIVEEEGEKDAEQKAGTSTPAEKAPAESDDNPFGNEDAPADDSPFGDAALEDDNPFE